MRLLAFDPYPSAAAWNSVWSMSICQPCSLNQTLFSALPADTGKLPSVERSRLRQMKNGVMIVNTSRGALIDSQQQLKR